MYLKNYPAKKSRKTANIKLLQNPKFRMIIKDFVEIDSINKMYTEQF